MIPSQETCCHVRNTMLSVGRLRMSDAVDNSVALHTESCCIEGYGTGYGGFFCFIRKGSCVFCEAKILRKE